MTVFAGYTDKPLLLVDGIGHQSHIQEEESKSFKYLIRDQEKIIVSVKGDPKDSFRVLGTVLSEG